MNVVFSSPFGRAFAAAATTLDTAEREKALLELQKILLEHGGDIIPVFRNTLVAHSPKTSGWLNGDQVDATNDGIARSLAAVSISS